MANPNEDDLLPGSTFGVLLDVPVRGVTLRLTQSDVITRRWAGCSANASVVEAVARGRGVGAGGLGAEHFHARAVGVV
eukprot:3195610-Rhodomonas_salina.1